MRELGWLVLNMDGSTTIKYYDESNLAKVISKCFIIGIATDLDEFKEWLKEYHKREFDEIFLGYKFFIETAIRTLLLSVEQGNIGIQQDFEFYRASFRGVPIEDIPNTCEKVIMLKRIWNICKKLRRSRISTITPLLDQIKREIVKPFMTVFEEYASSAVKEMDKFQALRYSAMFFLNTYLNDSHEGLPYGYFLSAPMFEGSLTKEYLKKVYIGYVYTLQFVWFKLLGSKFTKTKLVDLHRACEIYAERAKKSIELELGIPVSEEELLESEHIFHHNEDAANIQAEVRPLTKDEIDLLNKQREELEEIICWYALDEFFTIINEEILKPMMKNFSIKIPFDSTLKVRSEIDKNIFSELLNPEGVDEPEYMIKDDENSIKKRLEYFFLWYDVEVLDTQKITLFNGVPAFVTMLLGSVTLKKMEHGDKVLVRRIKHPANGGYDYSYAILIEVYGVISDSSGWIVFFDCATDYSGGGDSNRLTAETFIEEFSKAGLVEVKEMVVDKKLFKKFLVEKSTSTVFNAKISLLPFGKHVLDLEETARKLENFVGATKGKLLELLVYYYLTKQDDAFGYTKIEWDRRIGGKQIDVLADAEDGTVHIFECKASIGDPQERINELREKATAVKEQYKKEVVPHLVVWKVVDPYRKMKIEEAGIDLMSAEDFLRERAFSDKEKEKLKNVFDFRIGKYLSYL